jgi:hypothetical protein
MTDGRHSLDGPCTLRREYGSKFSVAPGGFLPGEWIALWFTVGAFIGLGTAVQGWHFKVTLGGVLVWAGGEVTKLVTDRAAVDGAQRLASVAATLNVPDAAYWLVWGALGSGTALIVGGSGSVFSSEYQRLRRDNRVDAVAQAGHRAAQFFTMGLRQYLAVYSRGALEAQRVFSTRRALFNEVLVGTIRKAVVFGAKRDSAREQIANVGRTMLLLLFEQDGAVLRDFRLGVYVVSDDGQRFDLWASADREDWEAHSREPLQRRPSFMGCSLDEGRPLVYPRDKKGRTLQKRGKSRWQSFLVMPLPCDTSSDKWGCVAIDHTGEDAVFDATRMEIIRDFARYVEILHTISQKQEDGR